MLPSNIEYEVKAILEKHGRGGWLRVEECAKLYAKKDGSKRTKFYRWRKQIEKGKVEGFQVIVLPGNISFIGLESADPRVLEPSVPSKPSRFGFFEYLKWRKEYSDKRLDETIRELRERREKRRKERGWE